jgi:hypothetical protein
MMYAHLALNNNHSLIRLLTSSDQYHSEREQTSVVTTSIKQYLIFLKQVYQSFSMQSNLAYVTFQEDIEKGRHNRGGGLMQV